MPFRTKKDRHGDMVTIWGYTYSTLKNITCIPPKGLKMTPIITLGESMLALERSWRPETFFLWAVIPPIVVYATKTGESTSFNNYGSSKWWSSLLLCVIPCHIFKMCNSMSYIQDMTHKVDFRLFWRWLRSLKSFKIKTIFTSDIISEVTF